MSEPYDLIKKSSPHLAEILAEMCHRVDADPNDIDFKGEDYFWKYSWTVREEQAFADWMVAYLCNSREAREELTSCPRHRNLPHIRKVVQYFLMNHGWKLSD